MYNYLSLCLSLCLFLPHPSPTQSRALTPSHRTSGAGLSYFWQFPLLLACATRLPLTVTLPHLLGKLQVREKLWRLELLDVANTYVILSCVVWFCCLPVLTKPWFSKQKGDDICCVLCLHFIVHIYSFYIWLEHTYTHTHTNTHTHTVTYTHWHTLTHTHVCTHTHTLFNSGNNR